MIDPIPASRIPRNENSIDIDNSIEDEGPDKLQQKILHIVLKPHIPGILTRPWGKPEASIRQLIVV